MNVIDRKVQGVQAGFKHCQAVTVGPLSKAIKTLSYHGWHCTLTPLPKQEYVKKNTKKNCYLVWLIIFFLLQLHPFIWCKKILTTLFHFRILLFCTLILSAIFYQVTFALIGTWVSRLTQKGLVLVHIFIPTMQKPHPSLLKKKTRSTDQTVGIRCCLIGMKTCG